jgi:predicted nucleic acid-binding protein
MKLVDADIFIDYTRHHSGAIRYFSRKENVGQLSISIPTKLEVLNGARNKREQSMLIDLLSSFDEAVHSEESMRTGLVVFVEYHLSHGIGMFDSMLAGLALASNSKLATRNRKHYDFIPGLKLETHY